MRCFRMVVLSGLAVVAAPVARAQMPSISHPGGPVVGTAKTFAPAAPPPPGLPGAVSDNTPLHNPPPPSQAASPNDALFDAINRGDMAEAQDALNRGADLNARNVLGMTPLELAVDLNRNDIAFLLLSIEHEHSAEAQGTNSSLSLSVPPVPAAMPRGTSQQGAGFGGESVADLLLANQPPPTVPGPRASVAKAALTADPPATMAGTGSPDPSVGFLGFGPHPGGGPQN